MVTKHQTLPRLSHGPSNYPRPLGRDPIPTTSTQMATRDESENGDSAAAPAPGAAASAPPIASISVQSATLVKFEPAQRGNPHNGKPSPFFHGAGKSQLHIELRVCGADVPDTTTIKKSEYYEAFQIIPKKSNWDKCIVKSKDGRRPNLLRLPWTSRKLSDADGSVYTIIEFDVEHCHYCRGRSYLHVDGVTAIFVSIPSIDEFKFSLVDSSTSPNKVAVTAGDARDVPSSGEQAASFTTDNGVLVLPGDLIRTSSAYYVSGSLYHVGMYAGNDRVIHLTGTAGKVYIEECSLDKFCPTRSEIHPHFIHPDVPRLRNRRAALSVARSWCGKDWPDFNAATCNCESFVTFCYSDSKRSFQGENLGTRHKLGAHVVLKVFFMIVRDPTSVYKIITRQRERTLLIRRILHPLALVYPK